MSDKKTKISCPNCGYPLHRAGQIRPAVSRGRSKLMQVYYCRVCGWRGV